MKTVNFSYKSIGNFVKLLATIRYENTHQGHDIAVWHECFDDDSKDDLFERFLVELFPQGKTIQPEDINAVIHKAERFIETDEECQNIRNKYTKLEYPYWVYFKPDNKVYPCEFAEHAKVVTQICKEFFAGFDDIDENYIKNFIRNNFEIRSDNSTVERIARDADFVARSILLSNHLVRKSQRNEAV